MFSVVPQTGRENGRKISIIAACGYYTMMQASEKAIRILIQAQRQCEEIYLNQKEPSLTLLPMGKKDPEEKQEK